MGITQKSLPNSEGDKVDQSDLAVNVSFNSILSGCPAMHRVFEMVKKVAVARSTVLILGESGTGKELIARAIHAESGRTGRLIPVNCGAIPEEILESELFGHERGAFTGAISSRQGRFQLAHQGTIFLDEIGEMSPKLQVKLLRVLQERKVDPVGSTRSLDVDVRVIAATHRDLFKAAVRGDFREDLYYRLAVVPIELPALREREGDTLLLANFFLSRMCLDLGKHVPVFSAEAAAILGSYSWPGNVRELENLMERLAVMTDTDLITVKDLPNRVKCEELKTGSSIDCVDLHTLPVDGVDLVKMVQAIEGHYLKEALERTNWNKKAASELLNLNRTTLLEKLKKQAIVQPTKNNLDL
jgi:transcriptional regulator with PAS, ATPase and Fis domain